MRTVVNKPSRVVASDSAALASRPPGRAKLVSDDFAIFDIGRICAGWQRLEGINRLPFPRVREGAES